MNYSFFRGISTNVPRKCDRPSDEILFQYLFCLQPQNRRSKTCDGACKSWNQSGSLPGGDKICLLMKNTLESKGGTKNTINVVRSTNC